MMKFAAVRPAHDALGGPASVPANDAPAPSSEPDAGVPSRRGRRGRKASACAPHRARSERLRPADPET